jgi:hypothetical protein
MMNRRKKTVFIKPCFVAKLFRIKFGLNLCARMTEQNFRFPFLVFLLFFDYYSNLFRLYYYIISCIPSVFHPTVADSLFSQACVLHVHLAHLK